MKIEPLPGIVQLDIKQPEAGVLDTSSKQGAVEYAEVVAVGDGVGFVSRESRFGINVGDRVFVKSWAVDIVTHEEKKYYFVNLESKGILAVVGQAREASRAATAMAYAPSATREDDKGTVFTSAAAAMVVAGGAI